MKVSELEFLEEIEESLDYINGERGTKISYCLYCGRTDYTGKVGLPHGFKCPLNMIKRRIRKLKNESKN